MVIFFCFTNHLKLLAQNSSSQISKVTLLTIGSWFQRNFWIEQLPMEHGAGCLFSDKTFFEKQVIYSGNYMRTEIFWIWPLESLQSLAGNRVRKLQMSQEKSIFEVFLAQLQVKKNKKHPKRDFFFCFFQLTICKAESSGCSVKPWTNKETFGSVSNLSSSSLHINRAKLEFPIRGRALLLLSSLPA